MNTKETVRDVARFYFGNPVLGWDGSLEVLGGRLDRENISYYEYFAYLLKEYHDTCRLKSVRNSEKVFNRYPEYQKNMKRQAELNAYLDTENFEATVDRGKNPKDVLLDESVELSPLFRYVMALTLGFYDIAQTFQEKARMQLLENREYFRTFQKFHHVFPVKEEELM
jgi:hypothetical protein